MRELSPIMPLKQIMFQDTVKNNHSAQKENKRRSDLENVGMRNRNR